MLFRLSSVTVIHRIQNTSSVGQMRTHTAKMKRILFASLVSCLVVVIFQSCSSSKGVAVSTDVNVVKWQLGGLIADSKSGNPSTIHSPYGEAVQFDGKGDALFLDKNPIMNLRQFTVEVVFRPDPKSQFEQRFLHMGEVNGDRMLIELRMTEESQWYLDAFIKSGDSSKALIDKSLLHPAGEWYHIALVVDEGKMDTYVAGKQELEGKVVFSPFKRGGTSIGSRMNKVSWFQGAIARIRITPKCLKPSEFTLSR
jgi:hypothetical protein